MTLKTLWLLALKLNQHGSSGNRYALTVLNPDPKDWGLSKTPIARHTFPTVKELSEFIGTNCKNEEFKIAELERQLTEAGFYATHVSQESTIKMGFETNQNGAE